MKRRGALILMILGVVLAGGASILVLGIARQANEASKAGIRQVYVLMAARDIPDQTQITADALVMKPFPADFAPAGAIPSPEGAVGKFAVGQIFKDQILQVGQVAAEKRTPNLSDRVPAGKVVVWLPMPDLLAAQGGFRPGDRMDILLSLQLGKDDGSGQTKQSYYNATQVTLQNVEVFVIGTEAQGADLAVSTSGVSARTPGTTTARPLGFLVDHQDAILIKFVKDSGGIIDLVLRNTDEERIVRTDTVTIDSFIERFRYRVPVLPSIPTVQESNP